MLYQEISDGIKEAMKAKDSIRLSVLRMIKSKIMAEDARGDLPDERIISIIKTYQKNLKDSLEQTQKAGRDEEVEQIKQEMNIVSGFLPMELTEEETRTIIKDIVEQNGYSEKKDFGNVMKALMSKCSNVNGNIARQIINEFLG